MKNHCKHGFRANKQHSIPELVITVSLVIIGLIFVRLWLIGI
jgi:hypothetical protein